MIMQYSLTGRNIKTINPLTYLCFFPDIGRNKLDSIQFSLFQIILPVSQMLPRYPKGCYLKFLHTEMQWRWAARFYRQFTPFLSFENQSIGMKSNLDIHCPKSGFETLLSLQEVHITSVIFPSNGVVTIALSQLYQAWYCDYCLFIEKNRFIDIHDVASIRTAIYMPNSNDSKLEKGGNVIIVCRNICQLKFGNCDHQCTIQW